MGNIVEKSIRFIILSCVVRSIAIEVSRHDHSYTDSCLVISCFHICRVEEANERRGTRFACLGSIKGKSLRERERERTIDRN